MSETWRPLGYNIRPRRLHAIARESVARYGGELPGDEATLRSFKGIGAYTAGAVLSFAFGQRAAILDTNVARVLFRVFVGGGDPEVARDAAPSLGRLADGAADAPRLRLQPGADGLRRDPLHRAQAAVPRVPDARRLRRLSVRAVRQETPVVTPRSPGSRRIVVTAAVIERDGAFLVTRRAARRASRRTAGSFRAASARTARRTPRACEREIVEELDAAIRVGREVFTVSHAYPDRVVELHFFACDLLGEARPVLGQEMRWVRRDELASLEFPPADEELILMLSRTEWRISAGARRSGGSLLIS